MLNLLRYTETPVGSYDELLMMPGNFETPLAVEEGGGKGTGKKAKNMRITVIWVSQKNTCWNGELVKYVTRNSRGSFARTDGS